MSFYGTGQMKNLSMMIVDEIDDDHEEKVVAKAKGFLPEKAFIGVMDVFYQSELDNTTKTFTEYPGFADIVDYMSGRTDVINISWSLQNLTNEYNYNDDLNILTALKQSTFTVFSAGNIHDSEFYNTNFVPESSTSPYDFTVGALAGLHSPIIDLKTSVGKYNNYKVADYSYSNPRFVDYFLSGHATNWYTVKSDGTVSFGASQGTSYAAPELAGIILQIKDWYPHYGYSQIRTMLEKNSTSMIGKNQKVIDTITSISKTVNARLDTKVLIEDLIEIFQGRNATDQEVAELANTVRYKSASGNFYNQSVGKAYRIYKSAFDREPDSLGLEHWTNQIDQGTSLESVAQAFIDSQEFRDLYGTNTSAQDFVTKLYQNVLDRNPDPAGLTWWLDTVNKGKSWSKVLVDFSESQENKNNVLPFINNETAITNWSNADEIVTSIAKNAQTENQDVPLADQISALYHVFLDREPTLIELETWVDVYSDKNENWAETCNTWMQVEDIQLLGNYNFQLNNYNVIQI
jgi:hypothetical protein